MITYTRSVPCRTCGGTTYNEANQRCIACADAARKRYQQQQQTKLQAVKDYAVQKLNAADPAQAFMARVLCTFAPKHIKTLKYKPEQIMNMLVYGEYDDLMIYDFEQLLVSKQGKAA